MTSNTQSKKPNGSNTMEINVPLVARLIAEQFPDWADLPIKPVEFDGWDNRTFHLGNEMLVRLPSAERYTPQVDKEQRWLPKLAPFLPLPIPIPLAKGKPNDDYPWQWSIYPWIDGENASIERIGDLRKFAISLAQFLSDLHKIDATDGPAAGAHSFYRGAPLAVYDNETRHAISALKEKIDTRTAMQTWEAACRTAWQNAPVWFHGDLAAGNLIVKNGQLHAVIDFGCSGVGDPACDLTIAWTLFSGESREAFRTALPLDDATWARGRGWALWKGLITLVETMQTDPLKAAEARHVIDQVLSDHRQSAVMVSR